MGSAILYLVFFLTILCMGGVWILEIVKLKPVCVCACVRVCGHVGDAV